MRPFEEFIENVEGLVRWLGERVPLAKSYVGSRYIETKKEFLDNESESA